MKTELTVYTDGASRGNPGPAGIGVVVFDAGGKKIKEISQYIGIASNNVAEYTALIVGLIAAAALKAKKVALKTDSELVIRQLNGLYKVKSDNIKPLFFVASSLRQMFEVASFVHISRRLNEDADSLASGAASRR